MKTLKTLFMSVVAASCLFTHVRNASAASIGAWFGKPTDSSTLSCWVQGTGNFFSMPDSVQNNCGGGSWDMLLLVQNSGHTVTIDYDGAISTNSLSCTLFGLNQSGTINNQQTKSNPTPFGILSMTATVPNSGSLLLRCTIPGGSGLHAINYNM